jgi:hypothetical protein
LMLYVELLLKRTNGGLESGFAPQNIPRECSGPGGIGPVFVHSGMPGNVPLLPREVLVFRVIRISSLTKRLGDCLSVRFDKDCIPLFLGIMGPLDCF